MLGLIGRFRWMLGPALVLVGELMTAPPAPAETTLHRMERKAGRALKRSAYASAKAGVAIAETAVVVGGAAAFVILSGMTEGEESLSTPAAAPPPRRAPPPPAKKK